MKLYKSIFTAALLAVCSAGFVSCDEDLDYPPVQGPYLGTGTWETPLTAPGVYAFYHSYYEAVPDPAQYYWATGYIVGCVATTETVFTATEATCQFEGPFGSNSNILIAVSPTERRISNLIAIQLPSGDVRNDLNLVDHPENLGREICLSGYIDKYLGRPGLRSVSRYVWGSKGIDTGDIITEKSEFKYATGITSGRSYAIVAGTQAALPLETESGFVQVTAVGIKAGAFNANMKIGFVLTAVEGQDECYYINDYKGRFLYVGKFNNGYSNRPSAAQYFVENDNSYIWQFVPQDDHSYLITNKASGTILLYDASHSSYGLYAELGTYQAAKLYEMQADPVTVPVFDPAPKPEIGDLIGTGTVDDPYAASSALKLINGNAIPAGKVYVKGIISSIKEVDPSYGNATFFISDDGTTNEEFEIFRAYYLDGAKFTSADQIKVGDEVVLYGELVMYGSTPEMTQGGQLYSINGTTGSQTPSTPSTPSTGEEKGDGTAASPYNVARANAILAAGSFNDDEVYIEGIVSKIKEVSAQYGNATYWMSDNGQSGNDLYVFRGYYLNGEKFTSADQLKVGDKLVIKGKLTIYKGTYESPQVNQGSSIVSINGNTSAPDTPSTPDTPDTPVTPDTPDTPVTGNAADFNTFNDGKSNDKAYATYTTAQGWKAEFARILAGGTDATNFVSTSDKFLFPCLNGRTDRQGKLFSPTISGGLKSLTFKYGFPYNEAGCQFTVNIKQGGAVVATKTVDVDPIQKATVYTFSESYNISGDFTIEIINDMKTNNGTQNKDRVAIWDLTWEN